MKREEKNQQTRRRIMDAALNEFAKQGYGASSVNAICASEDISKGIIYHYFRTKDDLFLSCVNECFQLLKEYLQTQLQLKESSMKERLEEYFVARLAFFREHPVYQRIFCEVIISPPDHLKEQIHKCRKEFDAFNIQILEQLLESVSFCQSIAKEDVIETFQQFQDFINARYQMDGADKLTFEKHEEKCRKALHILLYGVIERKRD